MNKENELAILAALMDEGYYVAEFTHRKHFSDGTESICIYAHKNRKPTKEGGAKAQKQ